MFCTLILMKACLGMCAVIFNTVLYMWFTALSFPHVKPMRMRYF